MKKSNNLLKEMSFVSLGTMFSRVMGYCRDMLVANVFGASFFADAFYAAFRIPNLFRRLFGESSLNAAFVPVLSEYLGVKSKNETEELISAVATVLFVILGIITILGIIFSYPITKTITFGFPEDKLTLTSRLLQIMFPFMWLICLSALGLSILNCMKVFFIPAASSASLSVTEIIFILFFLNFLPPEKRIEGLAVSVVVGGMLQLGINFYLVKLKKYSIKIKIKDFFNLLNIESVKRVIMLFIPVIIGFSLDQINALIDTLCASFLKEGSVTALYYSNRLMQLPLALFGTALATVALPKMSKDFVVNESKDISETINSAIRNVIFFLFPASVGLVILGKPIIVTLFERGNFLHSASLMTYSCLTYYSLGLVFFSISKILISSFYAMKTPSVPVKIVSFCIVINLFFNIILMKYLEVGGLALATTISSFIACILLVNRLKKRIEIKIFNTEMKKFLIKIFIINVFMATIIYAIKIYFAKSYFFITFVGILLSVTFYIFATRLLKIEETKIIFSWLNRIF